MNKINKLISFFEKALSKLTKISLLCAFGIFTIYPLGVDHQRESFVKNSMIPGSGSYFPFSDFVFISVEVIWGTGCGKFKWNEKGRSPIVLVLGPGVDIDGLST